VLCCRITLYQRPISLYGYGKVAHTAKKPSEQKVDARHARYGILATAVLALSLSFDLTLMTAACSASVALTVCALFGFFPLLWGGTGGYTAIFCMQ